MQMRALTLTISLVGVIACRKASPDMRAESEQPDAGHLPVLSPEGSAAPSSLASAAPVMSTRPATISSSGPRPPFLEFDPPVDGSGDEWAAYIEAVHKAIEARRKQLKARHLAPG